MCWCNPEDSTSFGFTWCQMCPDVPGNPCYSSTMLNTYCRPLSQVDYPSPLAICRAVSPFITGYTKHLLRLHHRWWCKRQSQSTDPIGNRLDTAEHCRPCSLHQNYRWEMIALAGQTTQTGSQTQRLLSKSSPRC